MKFSSLDRLAPVAVAFILILHAAVAFWATLTESVTTDEILYVTGGFYIDRYGDYRVQPENGVLPQRLHGLAALWTGAPTPPLAGNEHWRKSANLVTGYQFFYETGHDHFPMLLVARALNTLFSIGTGILVFLWGRRLAGTGAGLVAVTLYAADPNLLAHAALATSDLAAVFFLLASVSAFWWQLEAPSWWRGLLSALVFGLACVAKYSAVLLIPVFAGLLAWAIAREAAGARRRWLTLAPVLTLAHVAGAVAVIWLFYGFRYGGFSPELPPATHFAAQWSEVLPYIGWQGRVVGLALEWHLLPEAFLYGYAWVILSTAARAAFLAGDYGIFGWVSFFPLAFAWKTTLAVLAGAAAALVALARRWTMQRGRIAPDLALVAPLLLFFIVYWMFSLSSHLNIGHRHLLPVYPALFIWIGAWAASITATPWRRTMTALLLAAQLAASVTIAPHFLAFFNRAAGGPANGYRLLVDSSLDWGQDLPGLRDWLQAERSAHPGAPAYLSYFGSGEPKYYGIPAVRLPFINGFKFTPTWYELRPGTYCISATMLAQVYSGFGGDWTPALEHEYRQLRQSGADQQWTEGWAHYDTLRFARLCAHLRTRAPDAMIGYSILVYRIDGTELAAALGDPVLRH